MSTNCYTQNSSKDMKKKFTKAFDLSQIIDEPIDSYLESLGLWKKRIARDGSCLFRSVAEQIYPCQSYHERVRQECVRYMSENRQDYEKLVNISFDEYLEAMKNPLEYGGQLEISAMSKLYKRDFIIYQHAEHPGVNVTQNGYKDSVILCYSHHNHFDAVFTKKFRDNLALIQSLVYEILYDKVFGSGEQVQVARKLLRKSDTIYPKEFMDMRSSYKMDDEYDCRNLSIDEESDEDDDESSNGDKEKLEDSAKGDESESGGKNDENGDELVDYNNNKILSDNNEDNDDDSLHMASNEDKYNNQKMPLPYKVAKSLDPVIYRNTAFDAWIANKKEQEELLNQKLISTLQPGDRCLVRTNGIDGGKWAMCIVQNIHNDSANVFIPEFNDSYCVTFDNMKPYLSDGFHHFNHTKNVQKSVQPVNPHFSKIYANSDNKRRNMKKKQFSMKKSSSFHAFSTDLHPTLPTLVEVNEDQQNEDLFLHHHHHHHHLHNPHHHNYNQYNSHYYPPSGMVHSHSSYANFSNEKTFNTTNGSQPNNTQNKNMQNASNPGKIRRPKFNNGMPNSSSCNSISNTNSNGGAKNTNWNSTSQHNSFGTMAPNVSPYTPPTMYQAQAAPPPPPPLAMPPHPNFAPQTPFTTLAPPPPPPYTNPAGYIYTQPYDNTFYYSNPTTMVNNKPINTTIDQQNQRKRHGSYDSFLNKQQQQQQSQQQQPQGQNQPNNQSGGQQTSSQTPNSFNQQVPQLMNQPPSSQPEPTTNNYLLMPAPAPNTYASATSGNAGMQRSHSYHSGISNASGGQYDASQNGAANGASLYVDLYMPPPPHHAHAHHPPPPPMQQHHVAAPPPHHHQTGAPIYPPIVQQPPAQQLVMGAQSNGNNSLLYANVDNSLGYDISYGANQNGASNNQSSGANQTSALIDDPLMSNNSAESSRLQQNNIWNKSSKLPKTNTGNNNFFNDIAYPENRLAPLSAQPPYCYNNWYVVNIDGPINFNATHSLQDDGSDLQLNDINTLRFFYNLGIEYYRLNFAQNSAYQNTYQPCYPAPGANPTLMNPGQEIDRLGANSASSTSTNQSIMIDSMSGNSSASGASTNANVPQTNQVVPSNKSNSIMQPFMNSSRSNQH